MFEEGFPSTSRMVKFGPLRNKNLILYICSILLFSFKVWKSIPRIDNWAISYYLHISHSDCWAIIVSYMIISPFLYLGGLIYWILIKVRLVNFIFNWVTLMFEYHELFLGPFLQKIRALRAWLRDIPLSYLPNFMNEFLMAASVHITGLSRGITISKIAPHFSYGKDNYCHFCIMLCCDLFLLVLVNATRKNPYVLGLFDAYFAYSFWLLNFRYMACLSQIYYFFSLIFSLVYEGFSTAGIITYIFSLAQCYIYCWIFTFDVGSFIKLNIRLVFQPRIFYCKLNRSSLLWRLIAFDIFNLLLTWPSGLKISDIKLAWVTCLNFLICRAGCLTGNSSNMSSIGLWATSTAMVIKHLLSVFLSKRRLHKVWLSWKNTTHTIGQTLNSLITTSYISLWFFNSLVFMLVKLWDHICACRYCNRLYSCYLIIHGSLTTRDLAHTISTLVFMDLSYHFAQSDLSLTRDLAQYSELRGPIANVLTFFFNQSGILAQEQLEKWNLSIFAGTFSEAF